MTTWVLLRGWGRESRHWGDFPRRLGARLAPGEGVIAVDLPGNGVLHATRSPMRVDAMAAACATALARQGAEPPFTVIALSLGAMVALEWASARPSEVAGCVLINASFGGHSRIWQRLMPSSYGALLDLLRPGLSPMAREARILALTSAAPQRNQGVVERWAAFADEYPVTRANALRQLIAAARYRPAAFTPAPLLVLAAAGDRLVSPKCSRRFAAHGGLPLQVHPNAGHDLPLDDPEWVVDRTMAWRRTLSVE